MMQATHLALRDGHGTRESDTQVLGISSSYRFVFQDDHVRGSFGAAQVDLFNEAATTFHPYGKKVLSPVDGIVFFFSLAEVWRKSGKKFWFQDERRRRRRRRNIDEPAVMPHR